MSEVKEKRIATRLANAIAMICIRDSRPEDLPADRVSITKVGDGSDVHVVDAEGTKIPRSEVSRNDDEELRALMQDIVNRLNRLIRGHRGLGPNP